MIPNKIDHKIIYQTIKDWIFILSIGVIVLIAFIYTIWVIRIFFFPYISDLFFMLGLCETSEECHQILSKPPFFDFIYNTMDKAVGFLFDLFNKLF